MATAEATRAMLHHWRPWRSLAAVALATVVASACAASRTPAAAPSSSTTTTTRSTTTTTDATSAVLAAYQQFWRVWLEANDPPNPNDPNLEKVATGSQLRLERQQIARNRDQGVRFKKAKPSRADHRLAVLRLSRSDAVVQDCSLDDGVVRDATTGRVVNANVVTYLWNARLKQEGGRWKVDVNTRLGMWPGVSDCGLGSFGRHG
jgi:hypothetical protein